MSSRELKCTSCLSFQDAMKGAGPEFITTGRNVVKIA
jgi:hypothetical protein